MKYILMLLFFVPLKGWTACSNNGALNISMCDEGDTGWYNSYTQIITTFTNAIPDKKSGSTASIDATWTFNTAPIFPSGVPITTATFNNLSVNSLSSGTVVFASSGGVLRGNDDFYFEFTGNPRLGLGTKSPSAAYKFDILGGSLRTNYGLNASTIQTTGLATVDGLTVNTPATLRQISSSVTVSGSDGANSVNATGGSIRSTYGASFTTMTLRNLTSGSVPYATTNGDITQDNANFTFGGGALQLGGAPLTHRLNVSGNARFDGLVGINEAPTSGSQLILRNPTTSPNEGIRVEDSPTAAIIMVVNNNGLAIRGSSLNSGYSLSIGTGSAEVIQGGIKVATITTTVSLNTGTTTIKDAFSPTSQVEGNQPARTFWEADAKTDEKQWEFFAQDGEFWGRIANDAVGSTQNFLEIDRTGMTISSITFPQGTVNINGGGIKASTAAFNANTATIPAITFGDSDSGLYSAGTSSVSVTIDGNQIVNITSTSLTYKNSIGKYTTTTVEALTGARTFLSLVAGVENDPNSSFIIQGGSLTFKQNGYYMFNAQITYAANSTGKRYCEIVKNNTFTEGLFAQTILPATSGGTISVPCTMILKITSGDYVAFNGLQDSGSTINVGSAVTFLQVYYIGN